MKYQSHSILDIRDAPSLAHSTEPYLKRVSSVSDSVRSFRASEGMSDKDEELCLSIVEACHGRCPYTNEDDTYSTAASAANALRWFSTRYNDELNCTMASKSDHLIYI